MLSTATCRLALLLITAFSATAAPVPAMGRALNDFVSVVVRERKGEATVKQLIKECIAENVDESSALYTDPRGMNSWLTKESYLLEMLLQRYPELLALTECMLRQRIASNEMLAESAGKLMFVGISYFGSSPDHFAFIETLMRAAPPFNFTLGGKDDGYNVVHKLLDRDKLVLSDVVPKLLNPKADESYYAYVDTLVKSFADRLPTDIGVHLHKAGARLRNPLVFTKGSPRRLLGHSINAKDIYLLVDAMASVLSTRLLQQIAALAKPISQGGPSFGRESMSDLAKIRQPSIMELLTMRDKFGRTPVHIAAITSPNSLPHILHIVMPRASPYDDALERANASRVYFLRDIFGYTPRQLAIAIGNTEAAEALREAEQKIGEALHERFAHIAEEDDSVISSILQRLGISREEYEAMVQAEGGSLFSNNNVKERLRKALPEVTDPAALAAERKRLDGAARQRADYLQQLDDEDTNIFFGGRNGSARVYNTSMYYETESGVGLSGPSSAEPYNFALGRRASPLKRMYSRKNATKVEWPLHRENGGWSEPLVVSEHAREAVAAARNSFGFAKCHIDVLNVSTMNSSALIERFLYDHLIPGRPVVFQGMAMDSPLRKLWTLPSLLSRHAEDMFDVSEIPYAAAIGAKGDTLPLGDYVLGLLFCKQDLRVHVPPALVEQLGKSPSIKSFLADAKYQARVCRMFMSDSPTAPGSRNYVFNSIKLDENPRKSVNTDLSEFLPRFLNITIPHWSDELTREKMAAHAQLIKHAEAAAPEREVLHKNLAKEEDWGFDLDAFEFAQVEPDGSSSAADVSPPEKREISIAYEPLVLLQSDHPSFQFYVGAVASGSPMHYHKDAINFLIYGAKQWYLLPPSEASYSTVPVADFVIHQLPHLKGGKQPLQCTQFAGDVIYVPSAWGHSVLNLETSVGYALEFATPFQRY